MLMMMSVRMAGPSPWVRLGRSRAFLAGLPPPRRTLTSLSQVQRWHRILDAGADGCPLCHGLQRAQRLGGLGREEVLGLRLWAEGWGGVLQGPGTGLLWPEGT